MANYATLKAAVADVVKTNGNAEITGANMQSILLSIINSLGAGYQFMGVATPSTSPGTPDYNVFYIGGAGTYSNFGTSVTVPVGSICVFKFNGSWNKEQIALFAGIDDVPTANSENLVRSDGVYQQIHQLTIDSVNSPIEMELGYYYNITGAVVGNYFGEAKVANENYRCAKVLCEGGQKFILNNTASLGAGGILFCDASKIVLLRQTAVSYSNTELIAPQNSAYMYINDNSGSTSYIAGRLEMKVDLIEQKKVDKEIGKNLLDMNADGVISGKYIYLDNTLLDNDDYIVSDYIQVTESTNYHASATGNVMVGGYGSSICFYGEDKQFLSGMANHLDFTTPEGSHYLRISVNRQLTEQMVNVGTERGQYFPYSPVGGYVEKILPSDENAQIIKIADSALGNDSASVISASLSAGGTMSMPNYPFLTRKGNKISFWCNVTSFDTIRVAVGYKTYYATWFDIDNTYISLYRHTSNDSSASSTLVEQWAHGITISDLLSINIYCDDDGRAVFTMVSASGSAEHIFTDYGFNANGELKVMCVNATLSNCKLTATNSDFKNPLWIIGDSYTGVNTSRWPGIMKRYGYFGYMLDGLAGLGSTGAYNELVRLLNFGTPKYLVWAIGCNDFANPQGAITIFNQVMSLCYDKSIELIGITMANVPSRDGQYKTLNDYIKSTGVRYIDLAYATNPNGDEAGSTWYNGMLSSDGIHPTQLGAEAIAQKILSDFGEIMNYPLRTEGSIGEYTGDDN